MKTYKSEIMASVHETAEGLSKAGLLSRKTMREFDKQCLAPANEISPDAIRAIRLNAQMSQPVFARYLNVSKGLVSDWERGVKKPGGPALRLLELINAKGVEIFA